MRREHDPKVGKSPRVPGWWLLAALLPLALAGCEAGRSAATRSEPPAPERVYTLVSRAGGSDEVRVRCAGAFIARVGGVERHRVHCTWEFRKSTDEPLRFDPAAVRLEDPDGRRFGPSEVKVNGRADQPLDLSRSGAAFVDVFFDLGADYRLRDLSEINLAWSLDLGDSARDFSTRFYQQPRVRRSSYVSSPSFFSFGIGYSSGWHGRDHGHGGLHHGLLSL